MKHIRAAIDILVDELTVNEGKIADVEKSIGLLRIKLENLEKMKKQFLTLCEVYLINRLS